MAEKRRRLWWAGILITGAGFYLAWRMTGERMLIDHASLVLPTNRFVGGSISWLSDSSLLIGRDFSSSEQGEFSHTALSRWDIRKREVTRQLALEAQLKHTGFSEYRLSPDGVWLMSRMGEERLPKKSATHFYYICKTDGTRSFRQTADDGFQIARWLPDGRHWIEFYGRHVLPAAWRAKGMSNLNAAPVHLRWLKICDVDTPGQGRIVIIPPSSLMAGPDMGRMLFPIAEDRFLTWEQKFVASSSQVTVSEIGPDSTVPLQKYVINLQGHGGAIQVDFTPRGDRILLKLKETRSPGMISRFLQRVMPHLQATATERSSLWVSRIDGSGMRELGGVNNSVPEMRMMNGPTDLETGEYLWDVPTPRRPQWSPDGKRVLFGYPGGIWTVAVE